MIDISSVNIDKIKRYSGTNDLEYSPYLSSKVDGFSFVETIGNLVNNENYKKGYVDLYNGKLTNDSYIWQTLSAIGLECTLTIYENILNYIDNVSNIDLCKVKALKSIIKILGIDYKVIENIDSMPIELLNLIDVLSINKKYLIDNKKLNNYFISILSDFNISKSDKTTLDLSTFAHPQNYEQSSMYSADSILNSPLSAELLSTQITFDNQTFDQYLYEYVLDTIITNTLLKFINLLHPNISAGLSADCNPYIWQDLIDELITSYNNTDETSDIELYNLKIRETKIKYNIETFDLAEAVDLIENDLAVISSYSPILLELIALEYTRRNTRNKFRTYTDPSSPVKHTAGQLATILNLSRYAWYREQIVKEYITFCDNEYTKLLLESNIAMAVGNAGINDLSISIYNLDNNYFVINLDSATNIIQYSPTLKSYVINTNVVVIVAKAIRKQIINIATLREKIKTLMQKTYMKGTFLLLSYMINEYLLENVAAKYPSEFFNDKTGESLATIIEKSVKSNSNIDLIEYVDPTEYYNISTDYDKVSKNGKLTNPRFWEGLSNSISVSTNDLPFSEIYNFYVELLKLKDKNVTNLTEFLSVVFDYGASTIYRHIDTNQILDKYSTELSLAIDLILTQASAISYSSEVISSFISNDISIGLNYLLPDSAVSSLLDYQISNWVYNDLCSLILSANSEDNIYDISSIYYSNIAGIISQFNSLSVLYENFINNFTLTSILSDWTKPDDSEYLFNKLISLKNITLSVNSEDYRFNSFKFASPEEQQSVAELINSFLSTYDNIKNSFISLINLLAFRRYIGIDLSSLLYISKKISYYGPVTLEYKADIDDSSDSDSSLNEDVILEVDPTEEPFDPDNDDGNTDDEENQPGDSSEPLPEEQPEPLPPANSDRILTNCKETTFNILLTFSCKAQDKQANKGTGKITKFKVGLPGLNSYPAVIDWGDGVLYKVSSSKDMLHTYETNPNQLKSTDIISDDIVTRNIQVVLKTQVTGLVFNNGVDNNSGKYLTEVYLVGIKTIAEKAFYSKYINLKYINLESPDLTTIGNRAFYNIYNLQTSFGPSITSIGEYAFHNAEGITTINLKDCLKLTIGEGAFMNEGEKYILASKLTSVTLPDILTEIPKNCFANLINLTECNIPSGCTIIYRLAFWNTSLKNITIPSTVKYVANEAFGLSESNKYNIPYTDTVKFESSSDSEWKSNLTGIGRRSFYYRKIKTVIAGDFKSDIMINADFKHVSNDDHAAFCNATIDVLDLSKSYTTDISNTTGIIKCCIKAYIGKIITPSSLVSINLNKSLNYTRLKKTLTEIDFTLSTELKTIWERAFSGFSSISAIPGILNTSLTEIGPYAFEKVSKLGLIELPNSITTISNYAFDGCYNLSIPKLPNALTSIGDYAFRGCTKLRSTGDSNLDIPTGVTFIGANAFSGCDSIKSIISPSGLLLVGERAFFDCTLISLIKINNIKFGLVKKGNNYAYANNIFSPGKYKVNVSIEFNGTLSEWNGNESLTKLFSTCSPDTLRDGVYHSAIASTLLIVYIKLTSTFSASLLSDPYSITYADTLDQVPGTGEYIIIDDNKYSNIVVADGGALLSDYLELSFEYSKLCVDTTLSGIISSLELIRENAIYNGSSSSLMYPLIPEIDHMQALLSCETILSVLKPLLMALSDYSLVKAQTAILLMGELNNRLSAIDDLFLKYTGFIDSTDPMYNYKNVTHPSYLIHPYLFDFIDYSNFVYPIETLFYSVFSTTYDRDIVEYGVDNIIGNLGETINQWKSNLFDYSGYITLYEKSPHTVEMSQNIVNEVIDFDGAFFPAAVSAYIDDPEQFINSLINNTNHYYEHLGLSEMDRKRIAFQLETYYSVIKNIVSSRDYVDDEYDIYKYCEDEFGNSIILYKNYKYLYDELPTFSSEEEIPTTAEDRALSGIGEVAYVHNPDMGIYYNKYVFNVKNAGGVREWTLVGKFEPSYNDKKNTPGELWIRFKNHPIAFPAFDLIEREEESSLFAVKMEESTVARELNLYIVDINKWFNTPSNFKEGLNNLNLLPWVKNNCERFVDSVGNHLRIFYDMAIDSFGKSLLLNVPYMTGNTNSELLAYNYYNTDILVGTICKDYDYGTNTTVYSFTSNSYENTNADNIKNPKLFSTSSRSLFYEFIGFLNYNDSVLCLFNKKIKYTKDELAEFNKSSLDGLYVGKFPYNRFVIKTIGYTYNEPIDNSIADLTVDATDGIKYNISPDLNTNHVVFSYDDNYKLTFAYIAQDGSLSPDQKVIGYPEYSNIIEEDLPSEFGTVNSYKYESMIKQNVLHTEYYYNSFDSLFNYIVTVECTLKNKSLVVADVKHHNLNSTIGYIPVYNDLSGGVRLYKNSLLSTDDGYYVELLGQERSDEITITVIDNTKGANGRVTEDYKTIDSYDVYSPAINIVGSTVGPYTWDLSGIIPDDILPSNISAITVDLLSTLYLYAFVIYNTDCPLKPVFSCSSINPSHANIKNTYDPVEPENTYLGALPIGPGGTSLVPKASTNHIDSISSMTCEILFTTVEVNGISRRLPISIRIAGTLNSSNSEVETLSPNKFKLFIYRQIANNDYSKYHLFENRDEIDGNEFDYRLGTGIDFLAITCDLSDYIIDGIKPFTNENTETDNPEKFKAKLEFKYDEELGIGEEYPEIIPIEVSPERTASAKDNYLFYVSLDGFDTLKLSSTTLTIYDRNLTDPNNKYRDIILDTNSEKFRTFYDNALTLSVHYSVVQVDNISKLNEIILYFNYKNFEEPPYKHLEITDLSQPPLVTTYTREEAEGTYLILKPGESGTLTILIDYRYYDKISPTTLDTTIVGQTTVLLKRYFVMNISDHKPKFLIYPIEDNNTETLT